MTFEETLKMQLSTIRNHDLELFKTTLHENKEIVCIEPNGLYFKSYNGFIENHVSWFNDASWSIDFEILNLCEANDFAIATTKFRLTEKDGVYNMILSLAFQKIEGKWGLIYDQNTPIVD